MRWLLFVVLAACVDKGAGPQPKKIEASYVAENLVQSVPPDITKVDVTLGDGKIVYAGNRVDRETVAPGQPVKITHFWKVVQPPGPGWRVFALVRGEPGKPDFMNLPATDMEIGHPVGDWKAGEIIQDVQDMTLRADWKGKTATLYVGLIHTGGHDVGDRMAAAGPAVVDRAIVARAFQVDLSRAPPPPGTVYVPHANGAITIDGIANDVGWSNAVTSPDFQPAEGCAEPIGKAYARMSWDEDNFYVFVSVTDPDIVSQYKNHDDPLYKQDAVEVFIDADGNRRGYVELQVNPNNATFDSWFATTRAQPGDEKWDSGMVTAVKLKGTSEPGDADQGWDAEIAIPYAAVKGRDDQMNVHIPPQVGDRWRVNVVRVDVKTGSTAAFSGGASSWNRITCSDFHALDRMLTVVFADRTGSIVPAPVEPAGSGSGSAAGSGSATNPAQVNPAVRMNPIVLPAPPKAGSGSAGSAKTP